MSSSLCVCLPCWTSTVLLILRLPPTAALFPSRRSSDLPLTSHHIAGTATHLVSRVTTTRRAYPRATASNHRSEEHTSELQSRENLVCRLLLEKKNTTSCSPAAKDTTITYVLRGLSTSGS